MNGRVYYERPSSSPITIHHCLNVDPLIMEKFYLEAQAGEDCAGLRLDQAAVQLFPDFSRARLQQWIKEDKLLVNGQPAKAKQKLAGYEVLALWAEEAEQQQWQAESLTLDIVHEDDALLVINKPVGLVVHPAAGNYSGTLLNALLYHCDGLRKVPRAGIVHRLDKDTSGLMVVAKTLSSHQALVAQIQARSVKREYQAVVSGQIIAAGTVNAPLGRHPGNRLKQAVVSADRGREAVTHYRLQQRFRNHSHLLVRLETGRTHQIRVHMAYIGHPLVGDPLYGGRLKLPRGATPELAAFLQGFRRQALHAWCLGLEHPVSGEALEWQVEPPEDIKTLLSLLQADNA